MGIAKLTPNGRNVPTGLHSNGHCPIPRPKRPLAQPPIEFDPIVRGSAINGHG
jgi:hypothetical protein